MSSEEIHHITALIDAHTKRLRHLELQMAMNGKDTTPQILIEIDEIRAAIRLLNVEIDIKAPFVLEGQTDIDDVTTKEYVITFTLRNVFECFLYSYVE